MPGSISTIISPYNPESPFPPPLSLGEKFTLFLLLSFGAGKLLGFIPD